MSPDIAQVKKAQAEAPGPLRPRQPDEETGDLLVIVVQLGAVTTAGLADMQKTAGKRKAHPVQRHGLRRHPLADRQMLAFAVRLPAVRSPRHSFPRASLTSSPCMLISAYIFLSRWFSSNGAFTWLIIGASMPPYLDRDLYEVAVLIPCPRHSQGTGTPFLCLAWYVYASGLGGSGRLAHDLFDHKGAEELAMEHEGIIARIRERAVEVRGRI